MALDDPKELPYFVHIQRETQLAFLIFDAEEQGEEDAIWVPKSKVTLTPEKKTINGYECQEMFIPEWILKREGWI